jgi:hypothetical protein
MIFTQFTILVFFEKRVLKKIYEYDCNSGVLTLALFEKRLIMHLFSKIPNRKQHSKKIYGKNTKI